MTTRFLSSGASRLYGSVPVSVSTSTVSVVGLPARSSPTPTAANAAVQVSSGWNVLGGKWPHRLDDSDPSVNICYAVLRGAIATLVDFHDGRNRTDADVVDIQEVYEDALEWAYSDCGPLTFFHTCDIVGMDPERLRNRLCLLRTRINFHQYVRYQRCAICHSPHAEPDRWRCFLWPLCPDHGAERRGLGIEPFVTSHRISPVHVSVGLFRKYYETYRDRV